MNHFATIDRVYPMRGNKAASKKQPPTQTQADGFKPTYIDKGGALVKGDPVDAAELNFIFNDLYAQAANIDQILTSKGK